MRNKFKIKKIEGETFSFPFLVLEELASNNTDIIVVKDKKQMWLSAVDYLVFRDCEEIDDSFYKTCTFKFLEDDKTLSAFQLALCGKFHESFLNHSPFWEYINNRAFIDLLNEIAEIRKSSVVTPIKEDVFKQFLNMRKSFELPKTLTYMDDKEMNDSWYEFLNVC